jgi:hypothetical protein
VYQQAFTEKKMQKQNKVPSEPTVLLSGKSHCGKFEITEATSYEKETTKVAHVMFPLAHYSHWYNQIPQILHQEFYSKTGYKACNLTYYAMDFKIHGDFNFEQKLITYLPKNDNEVSLQYPEFRGSDIVNMKKWEAGLIVATMLYGILGQFHTAKEGKSADDINLFWTKYQYILFSAKNLKHGFQMLD